MVVESQSGRPKGGSRAESLGSSASDIEGGEGERELARSRWRMSGCFITEVEMQKLKVKVSGVFRPIAFA
jgi:hypothetical protein